MAAAAEITSGKNINAATDSVRPGQPLPTGDEGGCPPATDSVRPMLVMNIS
ncbi:hypothetical protein NC651_015347 [Populus alba x Populus x berolinensis]|nr:hypothetical protein NC651_015347 [Populus alba x Populus x berolinensis]